jgi:hypothetical protein
MHKNNVILLDEFDYYKSEKDIASSDFIQKSSLTKVLMTSEDAKQIIDKSLSGSRPMSGSILVASQINPNKYFDVNNQNLTENLREDFFETLLRYAPKFGASEVTVTYKTNEKSDEKQSEQKEYEFNADGSYKGTDIKGLYSNNSFQDSSNIRNTTYDILKNQKSNQKVKKATKEEVIKCFEEEGIAYKSIDLFVRMLDNFDGNELINEKISISKTVQTSDKLLKQLNAAISAKNILFSAQLDASYMSETKQALETFQSTELEITIKFHECTDEKKSFIKRVFR